MASPPRAPAPTAAPPPLRDGDRLTREEFERRYDAMPGLKKAELIEGVVHMPSPVRLRRHGRPHGKLVAWLMQYEDATPGVLAADNATVRLDLENEPQPDGLLMIEGGQARVDEDDYVAGAPELAAEVSASSASIDLGAKLRAYRRNGVREYLVWRVLDREVDWFALRGEQYERLAPDERGVLRSEAFPGLWLDVPALVRLDGLGVRRVLEEGLASPEHAAFVARLGRPAAGAP